MLDKKIKTLEQIEKIVGSLREENPLTKIVTTNGCFDLVHSAHVHTFERAKSFGDVLIVGLNSDKSVRAYKSPERPIVSQQQRSEMLAGLESVDYVVIFEETDPRNLLEIIKPDFHVKSVSGFKASPGFIDGVERSTVERNGGQVKLIEDINGVSTTDIIKKIKNLSNDF
jgi:rfaE bifunctional protein nucleotidyltransferase chain/domain